MTDRIASQGTARRRIPRRTHAVYAACRAMLKELFDPYRPERHYMRGPGPKWREKHAQVRIADRHWDRQLARAAT